MNVNGRRCTDGLSHGHDHHQPVSTNVNAGDHKQGVVFPEILFDDVGGGGGGGDGDGNNKDHTDVEKEKKGGRRGGGRKLLHIMRAVMFETTLAKKIRKKKQKHKQRKLDKKGNYGQEEYSEDENGRTVSINPSSMPSSSTINTSSSACSSSLSSNPRYQSDSLRSNNSSEEKQKQDILQERRRGCRCHYGFCFLLFSLFVLVFWGRVCAIVCTTTCLLLAPPRSRNNAADYAMIDSERNKKKIILEGLLERNH